MPRNSPTRAALAAALAALLLSAVPARAPAAEPPVRLVRVSLGPALPLDALRAGGFDIVSLKRDAWADLYVHPDEEQRLQAMGAEVKLLDDAVERHYAGRAALERSGRPQPVPAKVWSAVGPDGVFRV